jgi:hypothetical protein
MATLEQACGGDKALHLKVRGLLNGRWEVLSDRTRKPLLNVKSQEAAVRFAMLLAVNHSPTTVDLVG